MIGKLWRSLGASKNRTRQTITNDQIQTAYALMEAWGEFCETNSLAPQIIDECTLPYPKKAIFNSLLIVASVENDPEILSAICVCCHTLAYCQPNVGKNALWPEGRDMEAIANLWKSASKLGVELEADALAKMLESDSANRARYNMILPVVREEAKRMADLLDRMLQARS